MKKLILLSAIITICYACSKPEPLQPMVLNNLQNQPLHCELQGTYKSDSAATMTLYNQGIQDTIITNLIVSIVFAKDTFLPLIGYSKCKYDWDSVTKTLPFISHSTIVNLQNGQLASNVKADTIAMYTKSNKYFLLVKQ